MKALPRSNRLVVITPRGPRKLWVKGLAKGFDGRTLFEHFDLHLRAGDRVAIIGPNGVGKSTMLNIISRQLTPDKGSVVFGSNVDLGYYEQHQTKLHPDKDILNELWDDFPRLEVDRVRGVLALFLFIGKNFRALPNKIAYCDMQAAGHVVNSCSGISPGSRSAAHEQQRNQNQQRDQRRNFSHSRLLPLIGTVGNRLPLRKNFGK